ncbi:MAG: methyltransferase domain-containing protein [Chloroflexota bacterium]
MDENQKTHDLQASYDTVAEEYAQRIYDELKDKPLDRQLLDRFAREAQPPICDMGTGPGHVARYLHDRGAEVFGIDLSQGMVEQARQLNPTIEFRQGNMLALDAPDNSWGAITAFYSIIHVPRTEVITALRGFKRVLRPGGLILLAFHIGDETLHMEDWWDKKVSLDFNFFTPQEVQGYLISSGLEVLEMIQRDPYPDVEHPSQRCYIFARKPL